MNARDYKPADIWSDEDIRLLTFHPEHPPTVPWSGDKLRKTFKALKTRFAKVDDKFHRSGQNDGGTDLDQADCFLEFVQQTLHNDTSDDMRDLTVEEEVLLFAFWAFDKRLPQFITRAKPKSQ